MIRSSRQTTPFCILLSVVALLSAAVGLSLTTALAAPTPSPRPARWELDFKITHELRLLMIEGDYYWFMTYLVTNRTDEDQTFVPNATLYTDVGEIANDGDVDLGIVETTLALLNNPLLESKNQILGPLLQGKENAREGLFIWKAGSLEIDHVSIFIAGLSSDTQVAVNPFTNEETVVRKTLAREYEIPGDPLRSIRKPGHFTGQHWIMR